MLNDHERETLKDIEEQLLADDPTLAHSFANAERSVFRRRMGYLAVIICGTVFGLLMFVAGSPGYALMFAALAGTAAYLRYRQTGLRQGRRP